MLNYGCFDQFYPSLFRYYSFRRYLEGRCNVKNNFIFYLYSIKEVNMLLNYNYSSLYIENMCRCLEYFSSFIYIVFRISIYCLDWFCPSLFRQYILEYIYRVIIMFRIFQTFFYRRYLKGQCVFFVRKENHWINLIFQ